MAALPSVVLIEGHGPPLCQHGVTHQPVHELLMKGGEKSPCNDSTANDSKTEHPCWCHERTLQW